MFIVASLHLLFVINRCHKEKKMPCQTLCSVSLSLIQQQHISKWLVASICLLENTVDLYRITSEPPWPDFAPENTRKMINDLTDLYAKTHFKIKGLKKKHIRFGDWKDKEVIAEIVFPLIMNALVGLYVDIHQGIQ